MPRLFRPHVPLAIRVQVAERQLLASWGSLPPRLESADGRWLAVLLPLLAISFKCGTKDLRLDHDPPLALRPQFRRGLGKKTYYEPDANDSEHLRYRPHGAEFEGSHDVKTRIRGEHGQFCDITLIKRQRRREKRLNEKLKKTRSVLRSMIDKKKWPKRKFTKRRK